MRPLDIFFATMVAVLWGANYVAAKFGVAFFPPFLLSALRFIIVSIMLIPFVARPSRTQLKQIAILAIMCTLHFSLMFVAINLGVGIAGVSLIGQLGVPFACIFGAIFLNDHIGPWRIGGIVIAFIGTAIVAGTPNILEHLPGFYATIGSTLTWGIANVLIKRIRGINSMSLLAWMGLFTVPMLLSLSYIFEYNDWPIITQAPLPSVLGLLYSAFCSTIIAYGLWYNLLGRYNVSHVTPYSLLTPVFGIAFGQMFFKEELTMSVIIGGIITIIGVSVIVARRPKTIPLGEAT